LLNPNQAVPALGLNLSKALVGYTPITQLRLNITFSLDLCGVIVAGF